MASDDFGDLVHCRWLLLALLVLEKPRSVRTDALRQCPRLAGAVLDVRVGLVLSRDFG
jgi:hypothetical protein